MAVEEKSFWKVDSEAPRHMTGGCTLFVDGYWPLEEPDRIDVADRTYLEASV
jgi:hypothetical protein